MEHTTPQEAVKREPKIFLVIFITNKLGRALYIVCGPKVSYKKVISRRIDYLGLAYILIA